MEKIVRIEILVSYVAGGDTQQWDYFGKLQSKTISLPSNYIKRN